MSQFRNCMRKSISPLSFFVLLQGLFDLPYKWLKRTPSLREQQNEEIVNEIKALHEEVKGVFGYRRMTLHLNRRFKDSFNYKRIYRLMKIYGIQSVIRKKKKRYKHFPLNISQKMC